MDEVQEAVNNGKEYSYKIKVPNKTEFSVPISIWDTGTQEAFLIHVQQAKSVCKRKGLFKDYEDALEAESKANEQAKSLQRAIANGKKKGANEPSQSSQDERQPLKMPFWKRRRLKRPRPRPLKVSSRFMQTFSAKSPDSAGTKLSPVKYLQGNEHTKERRESMESFQDCITFHLLYMFPGNAAKQQRFYISNVLKKPQRVPVRYFFQRFEQLNGYPT